MKVSKWWSNVNFCLCIFYFFWHRSNSKPLTLWACSSYVYHEHVYYPLCHSFDSPESLSETFVLYLTESTRKAQTNTNAVVQLTFTSTGRSDWNWHSRGITAGLAFTVLCVLLSCWICASVTPDTNGREKAILHTLTTHEVASCPQVSA